MAEEPRGCGEGGELINQFDKKTLAINMELKSLFGYQINYTFYIKDKCVNAYRRLERR